jgi:hypothetical protein
MSRLAGLLLLTACASAPVQRAPVEGRTPGGIAYDVRGSGPPVVLVDSEGKSLGR